MFQHIAEFY